MRPVESDRFVIYNFLPSTARMHADDTEFQYRSGSYKHERDGVDECEFKCKFKFDWRLRSIGIERADNDAGR